MYVILPFEKEFFEVKHNYPVKFLGHPLVDSISNFKKNYDSSKEQIISNKKPVIAILPGSRKQEIKKILNTVIKIVEYFPNHQFIVAGAPNIELSYYNSSLKNKNGKISSSPQRSNSKMYSDVNPIEAKPFGEKAVSYTHLRAHET